MSAWYIFYDASIEPITGTLVAWMVLSSSWQINRLLFTDWNNPSATYYQLFLWLSIDERKEWNPTHVPVARHFWQWVIPTINLAERPMLPLSLLTCNSSAGTLWWVSLHIGKCFRTPNTLISKRSSSHVASYIIFVSANNLTHTHHPARHILSELAPNFVYFPQVTCVDPISTNHIGWNSKLDVLLI